MAKRLQFSDSCFICISLPVGRLWLRPRFPRRKELQYTRGGTLSQNAKALSSCPVRLNHVPNTIVRGLALYFMPLTATFREVFRLYSVAAPA